MAAGCGATEVSPTPETVIGTLPEDTGVAVEVPAGDAAAGAAIFESAGCGSCHVLAAAGTSGTVGPNLDETQAERREHLRADPERRRRHAALQGSALRATDRRRDGVRRRVHLGLILPDDFPLDVEVLACDLDRTLIAEDLRLRERTKAAIAAARAAGIRVLIVTGRMFQSVRPYAAAAGIPDPVVCYQGAAVVDPGSGEFLRHAPIPLDLARETITAVEAEGFMLNVYVDDELYVRELTPAAERYAVFQKLRITEVGDLVAWLDRAPTKLVSVDDSDALEPLEARMKERFRDRLHISKSLPIFLEFSASGITKGSGLAFLGERLGFSAARTVGFGDGENDVELLEWAGYGVAVANAHRRLLEQADFVCPPADEEGVAQVIEALLHSRS